MPTKTELLEFAEKIGMTKDGITKLAGQIEDWSDDPENTGMQDHYSDGQWIHGWFVQDHFFNKYDFDLSKVCWDDVQDLPFFTDTVKNDMLHMKDCAKCLKTIRINKKQLREQLVYRSLENFLFYGGIPCKHKNIL
jgi:hypothetical protein